MPPSINPSSGGFGRKNQPGGSGGGKKKKSKNLPKAPKGDGGGGTRFHRFGSKFWMWLLSLAFTFGILGLGALAYYAKDLPDISKLKSFEKSPGIRVYAGDGRLIASYGQVVGESLRYEEFPKELIAAVIATEDRRFFEHSGIDPLGLLRAMVRNTLAGGIVQGGSTITQQLAKNVFLTADRTYKRKLQEVLLAIWLENHFSKKELLELYLNRVYLGAGNYGVDAAAHHYFDKSARKVNLQEAALLAGLLKAPSRYAPTRDLEMARKRAKQVLLNMQDAGQISDKEVALAISHIPQTLKAGNTDGGSYRYFTDWVVDQLPETIGRVDGDLEVLTTFNPALQLKAQQALDGVMASDGAGKNASQAALLAMRPDGAVQALLGGRDYSKSQYNRAVQAKRQPGSAFKLLVYLAALEAGYTPESQVSDRPITIKGWSPKNYTEDYRGEIALREAFYRSINTVAALVTNQIGAGKVVEMSRRLGITSKLLATPSIALGTNDVTLLEMTGAFAHLPSGGRRVTPYAISEIRNKQGRLLYRHARGSTQQILPTYVVRRMNDLLTDVVQLGTARKAQIGRPVAGKTGTTQDYRDAWFLGFTPQLVAGVWVGNDDYSPMKKVTGGTLPTQIWAQFMQTALAGQPALPIPEEVVFDGSGAVVYQESDGTVGPQAPSPEVTAMKAAMEEEAKQAEATALPAQAEPLPQEMSPAEEGVFQWFDKNKAPANEKPVTDDTLLDKVLDNIKAAPVEYHYPDKKRR